MGSVISSKVREDGKIVFEICVEREEALQIKGEVDNICLVPISMKNQTETNIVQRGKNEATMYLLIPKSERETLSKYNSAKFQKITTSKKDLYIFTVEKNAK